MKNNINNEPNDPSSPTPLEASGRAHNQVSDNPERSPQDGKGVRCSALLGVTSLSQQDKEESISLNQLLQLGPSKVGALSYSLYQKRPNKFLVLIYCTLARLFEWRNRAFEYLGDLERRANTYNGFVQSYAFIQNAPGGWPRRVRVIPNDPSSPTAAGGNGGAQNKCPGNQPYDERAMHSGGSVQRIVSRFDFNFISLFLLFVCVAFFVIDRIEVDRKLQHQVEFLSQRIVQLETQQSGVGQVVSVNHQSSFDQKKHIEYLKSSMNLNSEQ